MKFAGFVFFSSLEYVALFYLILVLFRFNLRENLLKFAAFSIVLSFVSNTLQTESLRTVSPLIHIAMYIGFVIIFLRISLFNASIMVITGHVIFFMTQTVLVVSVLKLGLLKTVVPYTTNAFIIQAATAFIMFAIGFITYLQKGGFSFIDTYSRRQHTKFFVKENRLFIIFLIFSVIVTFTTNLLFVISDNPPLIEITVLMLVGLIGLVYTCMKRDDISSGRIISSTDRQSN